MTSSNFTTFNFSLYLAYVKRVNSHLNTSDIVLSLSINFLPIKASKQIENLRYIYLHMFKRSFFVKSCLGFEDDISSVFCNNYSYFSFLFLPYFYMKFGTTCHGLFNLPTSTCLSLDRPFMHHW